MGKGRTRPLPAPLSHRAVREGVWAQSGSTFRADRGLAANGFWSSGSAETSMKQITPNAEALNSEVRSNGGRTCEGRAIV